MEALRGSVHGFKFGARSIAVIFLLALGWQGCSDKTVVDVAGLQSQAAPEENTSSLEDVGNFYLMEGDILLSKKDPVHRRIISEKLSHQPSHQGSKIALCSHTEAATWPNNVVPFYFDGSWTDAQKKVVYDAMNAWANVSNVCFVELSSGGDYIIQFVKLDDSNGCTAGQSTLGYGVECVIAIETSWIKPDVVLHEIGHSICFAHEHRRPDRGKFIIVNDTNIRQQYKSKFAIDLTPMTYNTSYDVASIMHYRSYTTCPGLVYDINKPVLTTVSGGIINNLVLSSGDIAGARAKYGNSRQTAYSVTYTASTADEPWISCWTRNDFIKKYNSMSSNGYRLKKLDVTVFGSSDYYFAVFAKSSAAETWLCGYSRADFMSEYDKMRANGYRVNLMQAYAVNGVDYYSATFRKSSAEETYVLGWTRADFITKYNSLRSLGWRIHQFDVYLASDKTERYSAFFRKSSSEEPWCMGYAHADMVAFGRQMLSSGYRIYQMSAFNVNGRLAYSAFFRPGTYEQYFYFGVKENGFNYLMNKFWNEGKRLHVINATYD